MQTPPEITFNVDSIVVQFFGFLALIATQLITMWRSERAANRAAAVLAAETEKSKNEVRDALHKAGTDQQNAVAAVASALEMQTKDVANLNQTVEINKRELEQVGKVVAQQVTQQVTSQDIKALATGRAEHVDKVSRDLQKLVEEGNQVAISGVETAKQAYHEANQVNIWRSDMDRRVEALAKSVEALAVSVQRIVTTIPVAALELAVEKVQAIEKTQKPSPPKE